MNGGILIRVSQEALSVKRTETKSKGIHRNNFSSRELDYHPQLLFVFGFHDNVPFEKIIDRAILVESLPRDILVIKGSMLGMVKILPKNGILCLPFLLYDKVGDPMAK